MPNRTSKTGSELFIVDNSDVDWKVLRYLHDWCQISKAIDVATGYFEIGALLELKDEWQKVDQFRILMGDEVSKRTKTAFIEGLANIRRRLDASLEKEKTKNDFLVGVPAIVEAIRSGKIACRVYRKEKFHAKAYITHDRSRRSWLGRTRRIVELDVSRTHGKYRTQYPDNGRPGVRAARMVRRTLGSCRGRDGRGFACHRAPHARTHPLRGLRQGSPRTTSPPRDRRPGMAQAPLARLSDTWTVPEGRLSPPAGNRERAAAAPSFAMALASARRLSG